MTQTKPSANNHDDHSNWTILVDGKEIKASEVSISNPHIGTLLKYGKRPEGFKGFVISERGGSVILPYTHAPDGKVYVGLVDEYRSTVGKKPTLNAPRGMVDSGESSKITASRELKEETGLDISRSLGVRALVPLKHGVNPNSTYFDTSGNKGGVNFFALKIDSEHLELRQSDDGKPYYTFPDNVERQVDTTREQIYGTKFVPITEALDSNDMFTGYAAGQLLLHLSNV